MKRLIHRRAALITLFLWGAICRVGAQEPPPAAAPPALAADTEEKKPEAVVHGLAGEGKYRAWVHHTGSADEAVIALRVTATDADGNLVTRTGSGFVLRCDGFVVAPEALVPPNDSNFKAELSFVKREGGELTAPLSPVARPAFRSRKIPYVSLKVNDSHFPGLPVLHPANVRPDAPVRVTWAIADSEKPGRVKTVSRMGVIGAKVGKEDRYALRLTEPNNPAAPLPIIGAVVTDEKGIAALGMVTDATAKTFATFAHLDYICDEIGLCPTLADVPGGTPAAISGDMALIPGGPVRLPPGPMAVYYAQFYKTDVVCTPPFRMDKTPVTVGDYRAYLRRFTAPRLPQEWDRPSEMERDIRRGDLPATGMINEDAVSYAESLSKRLPTSVEWLEAAQGARYEWFAERVAAAAKAAKLVSDIYKLKLEHWTEQMENLASKSHDKKAVRVFVETSQMRELDQQQYREQNRYLQRNPWPPGLNSPVGINSEDVSAFGVRDVVTNAPEMTIRNCTRAASGIAPKAYPATADHYLTAIQYSVSETGSAPFFDGNVPFDSINRNDPAQIDAAYGLLLCGAGSLHSEAYGTFTSGDVFGSIIYRFDVVPRNYLGFRCAK